MARSVDYDAARTLLADAFATAEEAFREKRQPVVGDMLAQASNQLFESNTQAYREALIGCVLARILDQRADIRLPYANQGENAFNGRTLDERVVNPFLQERGVPCSKGPYLNVFRRSVRFVPETAEGLRDKPAFAAMLAFIDALRKADEKHAHSYLAALLYGFVVLREKANIPIRKIGRMSLEQYDALIDGLLAKPSGGLLPVLLATAAFRTIKDCYNLDWQIETQGINTADAASGASGDITVTSKDIVVLVVEVTERLIGRERVVSTFNTKISPNGLDDYLFFYSAQPPTDEAREQARKYFAQGHDINFVRVRDWIVAVLATIGAKCRTAFTAHCIEAISAKGISATVKQAWNDQVSAIAGGN